MEKQLQEIEYLRNLPVYENYAALEADIKTPEFFDKLTGVTLTDGQLIMLRYYTKDSTEAKPIYATIMYRVKVDGDVKSIEKEELGSSQKLLYSLNLIDPSYQKPKGHYGTNLKLPFYFLFQNDNSFAMPGVEGNTLQNVSYIRAYDFLSNYKHNISLGFNIINSEPVEDFNFTYGVVLYSGNDPYSEENVEKIELDIININHLAPTDVDTRFDFNTLHQFYVLDKLKSKIDELIESSPSMGDLVGFYIDFNYKALKNEIVNPYVIIGDSDFNQMMQYIPKDKTATIDKKVDVLNDNIVSLKTVLGNIKLDDKKIFNQYSFDNPANSINILSDKITYQPVMLRPAVEMESKEYINAFDSIGEYYHHNEFIADFPRSYIKFDPKTESELQCILDISVNVLNGSSPSVHPGVTPWERGRLSYDENTTMIITLKDMDNHPVGKLIGGIRIYSSGQDIHNDKFISKLVFERDSNFHGNLFAKQCKCSIKFDGGDKYSNYDNMVTLHDITIYYGNIITDSMSVNTGILTQEEKKYLFKKVNNSDSNNTELEDLKERVRILEEKLNGETTPTEGGPMGPSIPSEGVISGL